MALRDKPARDGMKNLIEDLISDLLRPRVLKEGKGIPFAENGEVSSPEEAQRHLCHRVHIRLDLCRVITSAGTIWTSHKDV
jgi:hypothetical protein